MCLNIVADTKDFFVIAGHTISERVRKDGGATSVWKAVLGVPRAFGLTSVRMTSSSAS